MKKFLSRIDFLIGLVLFICVMAFLIAADAYGDSLAAAPVDVPAIGTGILATLQAWASFVAPQWLVTIGAVCLEILGRIIPTKKPWSILYFLRDFLVYTALVLHTLGSILDKVLQQTNTPDSTNPPPKI